MRHILRLTTPLPAILAALAGCANPGPAAAPRVVALEARFGDMARARGSAVPLAGGLALTAAHVVDEASLREDLGNGEEAAQDGSLSGGTSTAAAAPARTGAAAEEADLRQRRRQVRSWRCSLRLLKQLQHLSPLSM